MIMKSLIKLCRRWEIGVAMTKSWIEATLVCDLQAPTIHGEDCIHASPRHKHFSLWQNGRTFMNAVVGILFIL